LSSIEFSSARHFDQSGGVFDHFSLVSVKVNYSDGSESPNFGLDGHDVLKESYGIDNEMHCGEMSS